MSKRSLLQSFRNALDGFFYCIKTQRNFRIHLLAAALALSLTYFLKIGRLETLILFSFISLVLILEMINTAFESLIDLMSPTWKKQARTAKDVAAGAVLLAAFLATIIGFIIFNPSLWFSF